MYRPVFDGRLEWLCEILRNQQGEIGVGCFELFILVGVSVDHSQELAVFFFHHFPAWIPAEGAHLVFKGRGVIHQLGLIQHRIDLRGDGCIGFDAQADIHRAGLGIDLIPGAHPVQPFTAFAADGGDDVFGRDLASVLQQHPGGLPGAIRQLINQEIRDRGIKEHLDTQVLQFMLDAGVNVIRFFSTHMAHAGVDQLQVGMRSGPADGIDRRAVILPVDACIRTEANIQLVHIRQRFTELLQANVLSQVTADLAISIDGKLAVAEAAPAGETGGNGTGLAIDAGACLALGAFALFNGMPLFDHQYLRLGLNFADLIRGEDTAGTGTDDDHIIMSEKGEAGMAIPF